MKLNIRALFAAVVAYWFVIPQGSWQAYLVAKSMGYEGAMLGLAVVAGTVWSYGWPLAVFFLGKWLVPRIEAAFKLEPWEMPIFLPLALPVGVVLNFVFLLATLAFLVALGITKCWRFVR